MFLLMVSRDCGISYHEEARAETRVELLPLTVELDDKMLRWSIETEEGEIAELSAIHKRIVTEIGAVMIRGKQWQGF